MKLRYLVSFKHICYLTVDFDVYHCVTMYLKYK